MEDKKYTDSDINTVSPSVSNTDLLEEDMMEDLISNVSTDKEKNLLSVFGDLLAGIYGSIRLLISSILTFFLALFHSIFAFQKVDISQLDDIKSAILIRRKILLSLLEGVLFLCFLLFTYLQIKGDIPLSFTEYCGVIIAFFICHISFSFLICNISNAGSDLFKRFNRNDFMVEFAYVKSIWNHQLWFFMILTLVIGPLFLVIETEFVKNLIPELTIAPWLIHGFTVWSCYLLILFFYNYSFSLFYSLRRFATVYVSLGKIKTSVQPQSISGRRPTFLPRVLVHILTLILIMYYQYTTQSISFSVEYPSFLSELFE